MTAATAVPPRDPGLHPCGLPSRHNPLRVLLCGVGGSGSRMALRLAELHKGLTALGRPGLQLHACDPKRVSRANLVRQSFYPCDVGHYKSEVLITRLNLALGTHWTADPEVAQSQALGGYALVVSCLDSALSRRELAGALERDPATTRYHLDLGNGRDFGQWVLGGCGLPSPYTVLPALLEGEDDDSPSCSALESLLSQDLYVNECVALFAAQLLWTLLMTGETRTVGGFVNLRDHSVSALALNSRSEAPTESEGSSAHSRP